MIIGLKKRKLRKVYGDYYALLYLKAFKEMKSREDAEDLCHNIFIILYNKFEEVEDYRTWLMGTLKIEILNFYRSNRTKGLNTIDIDDVLNDESLAFENGAREIRIIIEEALDSNSNYKNETERALFELIAFNGLSYELAGEHLGLTKRQAQYSYGNVTKRLIEYLRKKGITSIEDLL
ncbi:MAG: sigma-70 family RNA polymerase sigma factor [bacterium]|nr:sigma-70 family RNA polymerase sigma factor [bacterium]